MLLRECHRRRRAQYLDALLRVAPAAAVSDIVEELDVVYGFKVPEVQQQRAAQAESDRLTEYVHRTLEDYKKRRALEKEQEGI